MPKTFPTLGAAVLYINGFHDGKYLNKLNFIARHNPDWVMGTASGLWLTRDTLPADPADLLAFGIEHTYVKHYNEVH